MQLVYEVTLKSRDLLIRYSCFVHFCELSGVSRVQTSVSSLTCVKSLTSYIKAGISSVLNPRSENRNLRIIFIIVLKRTG